MNYIDSASPYLQDVAGSNFVPSGATDHINGISMISPKTLSRTMHSGQQKTGKLIRPRLTVKVMIPSCSRFLLHFGQVDLGLVDLGFMFSLYPRGPP